MHVNDNVSSRNMVLVPPIHYSAFYFPGSVRVIQPKVHPLAFMGDNYRRRVLTRVRFGISLCNFGLILAILLLAIAAAANAADPVSTSVAVADALEKKSIAWAALFVATLSTIGMVTMGKFMKEMHVEYLKQQVEQAKQLVGVQADVRILADLLRTRPCIADEPKHHK